MRNIKSLLYSSHFGTAVVTALIVAWPLWKNGEEIIFTLVVAVAIILSTMIGFLTNDLFDIDRDRINKSYRPLPNGGLNSKIVKRCCFFLGAILVVVFFYLLYNSIDSIFILIYFLIYLLYNYIKKFSGLLKNITISISFVLPYLFVLKHLNIVNKNIFLLLSTLVFFLYRELLMDINDRDGDAATEQRTIPVRVNDFTARFLVAIYWMFAVIFMFVHIFTSPYKIYQINVFIVIVFLFTLQNLLWNNVAFSDKKMRILLMSMWIPMALSVFLIKY